MENSIKCRRIRNTLTTILGKKECQQKDQHREQLNQYSRATDGESISYTYSLQADLSSDEKGKQSHY